MCALVGDMCTRTTKGMRSFGRIEYEKLRAALTGILKRLVLCRTRFIVAPVALAAAPAVRQASKLVPK